MRKYAFIAAPEECGAFKDKDGKTVQYKRPVAIFNQLTVTDNTGEVVAARIQTFKVSSAADFNVKEIKPGKMFARLSFDEYGRLDHLTE